MLAGASLQTPLILGKLKAYSAPQTPYSFMVSGGGRTGRGQRRRRLSVRGARAPLKFGKNYFLGNYYIQFGHFSGKNRKIR